MLKRLTEDRKNEVWVLGELSVRRELEKAAELVPKAGVV